MMAHIIRRRRPPPGRAGGRQPPGRAERGPGHLPRSPHTLSGGPHQSKVASVGVTPQTMCPPQAPGSLSLLWTPPLSPPPPIPTVRWVAPGCAHHARALAVADLRVRARPALGAPCVGGAPQRRSRGRSRRCWAWCGAGLSRSAGSRPVAGEGCTLPCGTASAPRHRAPEARDPCVGQTSELASLPGRGGSSGSGSKLTLLPWGSEPSWCAAEATVVHWDLLNKTTEAWG